MILKAPENQQTCSKQSLYTSSARVGFRYLLESIHGDTRPILIPAYIGITDREGSGVFDPIEQTGTAYEFYRLDERLSPNIDDLEERLRRGAYKALLVIHYFGIAQTDIERMSTLCREQGCLLIEDCAHTMSGHVRGKSLGSFGDAAFHSIHKCIPTHEGGILTVNSPSVRVKSRADEKECARYETLLRLLNTRWDEIDQIRLKNYAYLLSILQSQEGVTVMYPRIDPGIVPLNFPVIVNGGNREKLYFKLMERNIPTIALYYRLIDAISPESFPESHFLSQNILNLPIHQDVSLDDLDLVSDGLGAALKELA